MLRPRVIPSLLIRDSGLVKTVQFKDGKYVGDPINTVRIFNEKEIDELVVLDIDASANGKRPDYDVIANLAAECRMPLCYGGGIKTVEHANRIIGLGVEKISLSSAAVENPQIVSEIAQQIGSQSVVVVIDIRTEGKKGELSHWIYNGTRQVPGDPVEFAKEMERLGAGEIVINNISAEGTMQGYDIDMVRKFREVLNVPMTILGGAGKIGDLADLVKNFGVIGAAAGSIFVFKGKYRAVLVNYPSPDRKREITSASSTV
ncbi:MAG: imidazole glycerol phosphate synthase subunit HisF [Chloroflexi bacterium]|nr:imidazole glycerol phosphate synthase subunit HisF [Chloroflexota bacterium]